MTRNYRSQLTGLFGDPVDDNPTGIMEEAGYAARGLDYRYVTMKVSREDLPDAIRALRALNFRGVNLTMPHKIDVLPLLDELSAAARIIGAANTVIVEDDGRLIGENTDGKGFVEALARAGIGLDGARVTILGAGGAARAIGVECALAGASSLTVINRTVARAHDLADLIDSQTPASADASAWTPGIGVPEGTDVLINATSIGFSPDSDARPDIDYSTIVPGMIVSDVVFSPARTRFLQAADERGATTITGLGMLACQGARNFTLWTGVDAPLDVLEAALAAELARE
ncbi:shikimate dehydrogenase [Actinomyces sp. B33]|uniref:shikimate dehydrogenase n=1 Tax=Actinomyces sp. B33 TaxID=2942131 RepID=UPI002341E9FB|nr:shikimate dehydrogenase [Actinomyces sp. B33]MDC4232270.1 shikimate dehydrogenase [Actinomyces sp. B33]